MRSFAIATLLSAAWAVNAANVAVNVGSTSNQLVFTPSSVNAVQGDTVVFTFLSGPHTVDQSNPNSPCNEVSGGFSSGQHSAGYVYNLSTSSLAVGSYPFHCDFGNHCKMGMTGTLIVAAASSTAADSASGSSAGSSTATGVPTTATGATGTTGASVTTEASGATGTSTATSDASSASASNNAASRQLVGGGVLGAAMALLAGLAL